MLIMMISFLRADVLETGQFHRVSASNSDGLRDTTSGFVRSSGPTFLIGKGYISKGSFINLCPLWVCFNNWCFEGGNHDLQMMQKCVKYAYM